MGATDVGWAVRRFALYIRVLVERGRNALVLLAPIRGLIESDGPVDLIIAQTKGSREVKRVESDDARVIRTKEI